MIEFLYTKKFLINKNKVLREKNRELNLQLENSYSVRTMTEANAHYQEMAEREGWLQDYEARLRSREIAVTTLEKILDSKKK